MKLIRILLLSLLVVLSVMVTPNHSSASSIESTIPVAGYISGSEGQPDLSDDDKNSDNTVSEDINVNISIPDTGDSSRSGFYSIILISSLWLLFSLLILRWHCKEEQLT